MDCDVMPGNVREGSAVLQAVQLSSGDLPVAASASRFSGADGVEEIHLVVRPLEYGSIEQQMDWVSRGYEAALAELDIAPDTAVFRRFSCSDLPNQADVLRRFPIANPEHPDVPCAVSWVRQPPAPPARIGLWAYHICDPGGPLEKSLHGASLRLVRGKVAHHWTCGLTCPGGDSSYDQTRAIFEQYETLLADGGMTLADNVIRTWLFVQNIDVNYHGLVAARRDLFALRGLTAKSHYIASSGIEGEHADVVAKIAMDAYAIGGLQPSQVGYMSALDHLSPTHRYGVTFERGTTVSWRDRKHLFLSGTASIDSEGRIVHEGDVARQLDRTLENMEALLTNSGASLRDMAVFIVYLRDPADFAMARQRMDEAFPGIPCEVLLAPVCRPGWLIELEGMAVRDEVNAQLPEF